MNDIITVAEAVTYFAGRLNTNPWDIATAGDRTKAITMSTKTVEQLNLADDYSSTATVDFPAEMKEAACEIVLKLLDGFDVDEESKDLRIASERVAGFSATYTTDQPDHIIAGVPSVQAWRILQQYLADPTTIQMDRIT